MGSKLYLPESREDFRRDVVRFDAKAGGGGFA